MPKLPVTIQNIRLLLTPGKQGNDVRYVFFYKIYQRAPIPKKLKLALKESAKYLLHRQSRKDYPEWVRSYDILTTTDRVAIHAQISSFTKFPIFSVIMNTYNTPEKFLRKAIESVRGQMYPHWELCIADNASLLPNVRKILKEYERKDPRIKLVFLKQSGHFSAASNSALELATGDYVALLGHHDELSEHALYWMASEIITHPKVELLYSDEDKIDSKGNRFDPYFKSDWNQELLLGQNYICHLAVYRRQKMVEIGGFSERLEGAQDWDLALRFTEGQCSIRHVPALLYHRRILPGSNAITPEEKVNIAKASQRAVTEHLQRKGEIAQIKPIFNNDYFLPRFQVQGKPLVSIIIPTRNSVDDLRQCIQSLRDTDYPHTEILIIDNQSNDPDSLAFLAELDRRVSCRVLQYPHPFNYAAMHNWAVPQCNGEYLCLLNNDTEALSTNWLRDMLSHAQRSDVGAVGAKLLYPDGTIQHGGVVLGLRTIAGHTHRSYDKESCGYFGRAALVQNFCAVTAACLLMKKSHWNLIGGMSSDLTVAFNDVDLCLRLQEAGLRNIWLPHAVLYHHESKSRGSDWHPENWRRFALECAYMRWRWGTKLLNDPAYNPNLTLDREDFSLAWPPRGLRPWNKEPTIIDVPYGIKPESLPLAPEEEFQGSFPIPVGVLGTLTGIIIKISKHGGVAKGTLTLRLYDEEGHIAHANTSLKGSFDNTRLPMVFTQGEIPLQGQNRLFFSLRLEGATNPVGIVSYLLNRHWGHQIPGHEDRALSIEMQVSPSSP